MPSVNTIYDEIESSDSDGQFQNTPDQNKGLINIIRYLKLAKKRHQ